MTMQKISAGKRMDTFGVSGREILGTVRRFAMVALVAGAGLGAAHGMVAAQTPLGVPFIGNNHVSFYSTELTSDGIGEGMSTLFGGRYAHRFGSSAAQTRFSLSVQGAARALENPSDGIMDVAMTAGWTRRMDEIDRGLSITASAGVSALLWGKENMDVNTGLAHVSLPVVMGLSYDVKIGGATLSPFAASGVAYYRDRSYVDDVRTSNKTGWDGRFTYGTSLRLKELVLTTSRIRGEEGLPHSSRWAFAAGVSF